MPRPARTLPWLAPGEPLPPAASALTRPRDLAGLVAGGGALDVPTLLAAYGGGIFPWFSRGQPILWWSPDPRMVLLPHDFRLHRSLRRVLLRFAADAPRCAVRIDHAFDDVIAACAESARQGQDGTWIVPEMVAAYRELHAAGHAHSVETWIDGELAGGLYCVSVGRAVFGESMFTRRSDASKTALAALVALALAQEVPLIDCQQNTRHLASLGAAEMPRADFLQRVAAASAAPPLAWHFDPRWWRLLPGMGAAAEGAA